MSQWTHVAGCIRYDWIEVIMGSCPLEQVLGTPGDFNNLEKIKDIPTGTEGSIQYEILKASNDSSIAAYIVPIWGDLRNFGEEGVPEIKEWFNRATKGSVKSITSDGEEIENPVIVRSAILKINVEYGGTYILKDKD